MKKGLILIFMLFLIPIALADDFSSSFTLSNSELHLGESTTLKGRIDYNGEPLKYGFALIEFIEVDNPVYTVAAPINNGEFTSTIVFTKKPNGNPFPSGEYSINVNIFNGFGSSEKYETVKTVKINNKIKISSQLDKDLPYPGEEVRLFGDILYESNSERVSDANFKINLDGKEYNPSLKNGEFSLTFNLPLDISSKDNEISLEIEDDYGNLGLSSLLFDVKGIQYQLKADFNKESFIPEEEIEITPLLYDQSNDLLEDDITIEIFNTKKESVFSKITKTSQPVLFRFPEYAKPGEWKIELSSSKLEYSDTIKILDYEKLDFRIEDSILVVKNIGNINYDKKLLINAVSDSTTSIVKNINLKPGEESVFDLSKELPQGSYDLNIEDKTFSGFEVQEDNRNVLKKTTDAVGLTGKAISDLPEEPTDNKNASYLLIAILAAAGIYGFYYIRKNKTVKKEEPKNSIIKDPLKGVTKKVKYEFGKATDADIKSFKERILQDLKESPIRKEEPKTASQTFDFDKPLRRNYREEPKFEKKDPPTKGAFSMFD